MNNNTKIVADLGIIGDDAVAFLELLRDEYGVTFDPGLFEECFPEEFPGKSWLEQIIRSFLPFRIDRSPNTDLRLWQIALAIDTGKLVATPHTQ